MHTVNLTQRSVPVLMQNRHRSAKPEVVFAIICTNWCGTHYAGLYVDRVSSKATSILPREKLVRVAYFDTLQSGPRLEGLEWHQAVQGSGAGCTRECGIRRKSLIYHKRPTNLF